eukprot:8390351-Ditylum_brightwellii.AAC.1
MCLPNAHYLTDISCTSTSMKDERPLKHPPLGEWMSVKIPLFATKTVSIVTAFGNLCPSMDPVLGSTARS